LPKPRAARNKPLPRRWRFKHGAFYYRVPPGLEAQWDGKSEFRLGGTLAEAAKAWADRLGEHRDPVHTIGALLDRYELEVVPHKAAKTRTENHRHIAKLRGVFGRMPLSPFPPKLVYMYVDKRGAKIAAHREIEVLSHAYTKAIEWGLVDRHPFRGQVRLEGERPRVRYVDDADISAVLSMPPVRKLGSVGAIQSYIRLKLTTGLRRGDLLRLRMEHLRGDGIHVVAHKTGKRTVFEWTPERRAAVDAAIAARPCLSPFLFCNRRGEGYVNEETGLANGWDSMWQRFMDRVLKETKVTERFTEHDLRAKVGSDAESLERARALLQHADARTTLRVYRRKPERV
jgi:integrase